MVERRHVIMAAILATAAGTGGGVVVNRAMPPPVIERVVRVHETHKYDWGALTGDEQKAAAIAIGSLDRREVEIFCGVPACQDLAEDVDELMDMTGAASAVRRPIIDLGAGMGISPADDDARKIAMAIKEATHGRIDLKIIDQKQPGGGLVIAIGQKPRH